MRSVVEEKGGEGRFEGEGGRDGEEGDEGEEGGMSEGVMWSKSWKSFKRARRDLD